MIGVDELKESLHPDKHEIDGVRKEKERLTAASISVYQRESHERVVTSCHTSRHYLETFLGDSYKRNRSFMK